MVVLMAEWWVVYLERMMVENLANLKAVLWGPSLVEQMVEWMVVWTVANLGTLWVDLMVVMKVVMSVAPLVGHLELKKVDRLEA